MDMVIVHEPSEWYKYWSLGDLIDKLLGQVTEDPGIEWRLKDIESWRNVFQNKKNKHKNIEVFLGCVGNSTYIWLGLNIQMTNV